MNSTSLQDAALVGPSSPVWVTITPTVTPTATTTATPPAVRRIVRRREEPFLEENVRAVLSWSVLARERGSETPVVYGGPGVRNIDGEVTFWRLK